MNDSSTSTPRGLADNFFDELAAVGIRAKQLEPLAGIVAQLAVKSRDWSFAAQIAMQNNLRWSAVWGDHQSPRIVIRALLFGGDGHLLLQTEVPEDKPELPSQTEYFMAADRPERYLQDMFGVRFLGKEDQRRWGRHQAWDATDFPLLDTFPVTGRESSETPPDNGEKIAVGRDLEGLIKLAGRVSGDSTVTHSWAACQAVERALQIEVPSRALALRGILSERERIANHLGDIGAICNDVGFAFAQYQMSRLRELWQRQNLAISGHRLLMDVVAVGGIKYDLDDKAISQMKDEITQLRSEVEELLPLLLEYPSLQDRLLDYAIFSPESAQKLGAVGYVGRASGLADDLRRDCPYTPYRDIDVDVPVYVTGDLTKRLQVRGEEVFSSLDILTTLLNTLPDGDVVTDYTLPDRDVEGIGLIEGWRGETLAYVRLGAAGKVLRYFPRDPSWLTWQALEMMLDGVIVPDFPVCNKSVNGSYSGHDL